MDPVSTVIDTGLVTELIALIKSVLSLFTVFPLNIFIIAGLVGVAFGIFRAAKRASRN